MNENNSHINKHIKLIFGNKTLYEILEISSTSTINEINKSYRKLALKYHPDRGGDSEVFKALSMVHYILSNENSKKEYDEYGIINENNEGGEGEEGEEEFEFWYNYYRQLYPKINENDIKEYERNYKGSNEEINDIIELYNKYSGNLKNMMECIMFAEDGDEERIIEIIDNAIENNLIEITSKYTKSKTTLLKKKKTKKSNKQQDIDITSESNTTTTTSLSTRTTSNTTNNNKSKKNNSKSNDESEESLRMMILNRRKDSQSNAMNSIIEKYMEPSTNLGDYDLDEEEFQKAQAKVLKKKKGGSKKDGDGSGKKPRT